MANVHIKERGGMREVKGKGYMTTTATFWKCQEMFLKI